MTSNPFLSPSAAARRLGVSAKALRLYEERGLIAPARTTPGWRAYGPAEMARAAEIVALRALGLGLAQVKRALQGDMAGLAPALAAHQASLEGRIGDMHEALARLRRLRERLDAGDPPSLADLIDLHALQPPAIVLDLPWPWGGERFELPRLPPLTWITGPLFSGKTVLARALAVALPAGVFIGLDRIAANASCADALAVLRAILADGSGPLVIDMIEHGLDARSQGAMADDLRRRGPGARPVLAMTRSSAMLDLAAVGASEAILYCPANHGPPILVARFPGSPGYEAVESCLASPEVRARTSGVVATYSPAA